MSGPRMGRISVGVNAVPNRLQRGRNQLSRARLGRMIDSRTWEGTRDDGRTVTAVSRSVTHTMTKPNDGSIRLLAGLGVEGDAHLGNDRQTPLPGQA